MGRLLYALGDVAFILGIIITVLGLIDQQDLITNIKRKINKGASVKAITKNSAIFTGISFIVLGLTIRFIAKFALIILIAFVVYIIYKKKVKK